jgi:hypothetical protein
VTRASCLRMYEHPSTYGLHHFKFAASLSQNHPGTLMVPHRALLSLSILCLTAPRGLAVGDPVKVAASIGQARSSPLFGFGNELLFQTSTDGGLNGELVRCVCASGWLQSRWVPICLSRGACLFSTAASAAQCMGLRGWRLTATRFCESRESRDLAFSPCRRGQPSAASLAGPRPTTGCGRRAG